MSDQLPIGQMAISQMAPTVVTGKSIRDSGVTTAKTIDTSDFKTLEQLEKEYIEKALVLFENNKSRAAQALGVTTKTLYNKLHAYGLFEKYSSAK